MPVNLRFKSAFLKIERANQHARELEEIFGKYLKADFCAVRIENDVLSGRRRVVARSKISLPESIALALGDTIHNLSSALDHMTHQLISGQPFPLHETRDALIRSFDDANPSGGKGGGGTKAGGNHALKLAFPALADIIVNEIKPYATGEGADDRGRAVWRLRKLDNIDKHRMIIPVLNIHSVNNFTAGDHVENRLWSDITAHFTAGQCVSFGEVGPNMEIYDYGHASADMVFPEGTYFDNKPVISTLVQISQFALEVVEAFEKHFSIDNETTT